MSVLRFRVDSRLVHGPVCATWIPFHSVTQVVVVHDLYAGDPSMTRLHAMMMPPGVTCHTHTLQDAASRWKEGLFEGENSLVLFQTLETALKAHEAGLCYAELHLALAGRKPESTPIYPQVCVDAGEIALIGELEKRNVRVYCQRFPQDAPVPVRELLAQHGA